LCDFELDGFPAIRAWLKRVAAQAAHVAMDFTPAAAISAA
jgi:glutathione S-transferase